MNNQCAFDTEFNACLSELKNLALLSRLPRVAVVLDSYPFTLSAKALNCLPLIVHNELGGAYQGACTLGASFMLLNLSSEVLDDLQDRDGHLPWVTWGPADATNVALAMTFQAFELLGTLNHAHASFLIRALAGAGVSASIGQIPPSDPTVSMTNWLRQAREKSGVVMAAGALIGAIAATSDEEIHTRARHFGLALGVLSQAVDDVIDLIGADAKNPIASDNLCVVVADRQSVGARFVSKEDVVSRPVIEAALRIIDKLEADTKTCEGLPLLSKRLMTHVVNQGASLEQLARVSQAKP